MEEAPVQVGVYRITETLGAGGMGIVFKALDPAGKEVAIKMIGSKAAIDATLHAAHAVNKAPAFEEKNRMMLVREASTAMRLDHPNIVRVFDYGTHHGPLYIVMEYLPGRSLDKIIPIHASVPLATKLRLIRQICDALEFAHRKGVMHRDVKPANTMVLRDAKVKVLDFGLAARLREPLPGEIAFVGTPQYMAPEVVAGSQGYDARVDIWATGVTFYQLLTGRLPFASPSIGQLLSNIARAKFPRLDPRTPHCLALERMLDRALAKNPLERYSSAGDFAYDLMRLEEEVSAEPSAQASAPSTPSEEDAWSGSTAMPASPSPVLPPSPASEVVSMISGEIRAWRGGHLLRFNEFNAKVMGPVWAGGFYGVGYALAVMNHWSGSEVGEPMAIFASAVPVLVAIGAVLWLFVLWEKIHGVPACRECDAWMAHRSRSSCFAYSQDSWAHASSDCLAALQENLWEDAAKLLAMHGEKAAPEKENAASPLTSYPLIRYHLDFFFCGRCGDECALFTTEDLIGKTWNTREEYAGAYKAKVWAGPPPPLLYRLSRVLKAVPRAVRLAVTPALGVGATLTIGLAAFLSFYYFPFVLGIIGAPGHRASITIASEPAGQSILVDGRETATPKTFDWRYGSIHSVGGLESRRIGGTLYRFLSVSPATNVRVVAPGSQGYAGRAGQHDITVASTTDELGRPANRPAVSIYTVLFSPNQPPPESPLEAMERTLQDVRSRLDPSSTVVPGATSLRPGFQVISEPPGLKVIVDGRLVQTPQSYAWPVGSTHSLSIPGTPQALPGNGSGTQPPILYGEGHWFGDKGEGTIRLTVPRGLKKFTTTTYAAKFHRLAGQSKAAVPPTR